MLEKLIDQIFPFIERNKLKRGHAVHGNDDGLRSAKSRVMAQLGFCFTQRNHFHGRETLFMPLRPSARAESSSILEPQAACDQSPQENRRLRPDNSLDSSRSCEDARPVGGTKRFAL